MSFGKRYGVARHFARSDEQHDGFGTERRIGRHLPVQIVRETGGVQLQVASFASIDNAERALSMLRGAGVPGARLQDATVGGKRIWRLRVGPLAADAVSPLASRIAGLGFGQPAIVRE